MSSVEPRFSSSNTSQPSCTSSTRRTAILKLKHQPTPQQQHQKNRDYQAQTPANPAAPAAPEEQRFSSSNTSQPSCTSSTRRTAIIKLKHQPTQQQQARPAAVTMRSSHHPSVTQRAARAAGKGHVMPGARSATTSTGGTRLPRPMQPLPIYPSDAPAPGVDRNRTTAGARPTIGWAEDSQQLAHPRRRWRRPRGYCGPVPRILWQPLRALGLRGWSECGSRTHSSWTTHTGTGADPGNTTELPQ